MQGGVGHENLYKLRVGLVKNPTRETLLALCIFFRVPPIYFFPELEGQEFDPLPDLES
jgi:transcriptional regulator with XRE-family HTH domain